METVVRVQLVRDASASKEMIRGAKDVVKLCSDMRRLDREHFRVLFLDARKGILGMETVAIGTLNASIIHPREVFKAAILLNAAAIILVHNHPTGDPTPSDEDSEITRNLVKAGDLLGIEVLDHVVIGEGWHSFAESNLHHLKDGDRSDHQCEGTS